MITKTLEVYGVGIFAYCTKYIYDEYKRNKTNLTNVKHK